MNISLCIAAACLCETLSASATVILPGPYRWGMDGSTTAASGQTTVFHMNGESIWWQDLEQSASYQDLVIGGTWDAGFDGAYCELHKDLYQRVPGWQPPGDPNDPDSAFGVNIMPYHRQLLPHAYALPGGASASTASGWYSESFTITNKVWQYWLSTSWWGDYARIFLGDTLVAGGQGKISVSGLLGPGTYRVEIFARVDAARGADESVWGSAYFEIPSPGPLSLALLSGGLLCPRRRRATH